MSPKTPLKYSTVSRRPRQHKKQPVSYFAKSAKYHRLSSSSSLSFRGLLRYLLGIVGLGLFSLLVGYVYLSHSLPDLDNMADMVLPEATEVKDRNGEILYRIFQENRSYVQYEEISPHLVNAVVAIEDQSFWTNSGIDYWGIVRAVRNTLFKGSSEGASTITQQLLKNIILNQESSKYARKLKEWLLAGKLNKLIKKQIKQEYPNIGGDELQKRMKQEIMEMYLNYIFLGQNSYGVEAASHTFFSKDAKNVTPLESAILASLPKSPTKYNPYVNPHHVMGKLHFFQGDEEVPPSDNVLKKTWTHIETLLPRLQMDNKDVASLEKQLYSLMQFSLTVDGSTYRITYDLGRKDYVLMNMYDEGYIEAPAFKKAFVDGFGYDFQEGKNTNIKAPHFVRWVQDEVLKLFPEEGENLLQRGGLQITTTLDYQMQQWAEKSVAENYRSLQGYGANNAGLVYLDSTNGDVLTYVGSADYFNKEIDGEVDMVRAMRQPGSSIKPFIYALGIEKLGLTLDTPLFDLALKVGRNEPQNSDGKFMGLMPLRKALAFSRNIAPIKIFLALGGEDAVKPRLWNLGLKGLSARVGYGYPLAIGAGEVQMLELANAYAHLSTSGRPAVINPILRITSSDGTILYEKKTQKQKQIIPDGVANMVAQALSDKKNMPTSWVDNYTLPGRLDYATKSGTSDMKITVAGKEEIRARDGWLASYTPSKVAIFWAGNTDGKPLGPKAFGGWLNAPIWKAFFGQLIKNNLIGGDVFPTNGTTSLMIDRYSGLLTHGALPDDAAVSTIAYGANMPRKGAPSWSSFEFDKSCGGKVSPLTPDSDIVTGRLVQPTTFMSDKRDLPAITSRFASQDSYFLQKPEQVCEGRGGEIDDQIVVDILKPTAGSIVAKQFDVWYNIRNTRVLSSIRIFLNDIKVAEKQLRAQKELTDQIAVKTYQGLEPGEHLLTIEVADIEGFVNRRQIPLTIASEDTVAPYLQTDRVRIDQGSGSYTVYFVFADDASSVSDIQLSAGGNPLEFAQLDASIVTFVVTELGSVTYTVKDAYGNTNTSSIDLTSYSN